MNTDRRIYFTTAVVALIVAAAISVMARATPLGSVTSIRSDGDGSLPVVVHVAREEATL